MASSSTMGTTMRVEGVERMRAAFKILPRRLYTRVVKKANHAAIKPALQKARENIKSTLTQETTGAYRKSLAIKTKQYSKSVTTYSLVGAKSDYSLHGTVKRTKRKVFRRPEKYAHLLEFGHRIAPRFSGALLDRWKTSKGGAKKFIKGNSQSLGNVQPYPVISDAYKAVKGQMIPTWAKVLDSGLKNEVTKLGLKVT